MPSPRQFTLDDEPTPPPPPVSTTANDADDALSDVADTVVSEIPEPQQHAIDQAIADNAKESGGETVSGDVGELDALGVPWNREYHATGKDGKGVKTAKGTWRRRRGLGGSASHVATPTSKAATAAPVGPTQHELACRQGGMMAARLLVHVSMGIGGPEFAPRMIEGPGGMVINEMQTLEVAFGDYFLAKDIEDLPPGWALCGALAFYYLPRFQMPQTKEKARGFAAWLKGKWADWRVGKMKKKWNGEAKREQPKETEAQRDESRTP
jgi:hypothetical protein